MSELPPNVPPKPEPLSYRGPSKKKSRGLLIAAWVMAAIAGIYCVVIIAMLTSDTPGYALFLGGMAVVIVLVGILSWRFGASAALAIVIASVCVGILTFGTCAAAVLGSFGR